MKKTVFMAAIAALMMTACSGQTGRENNTDGSDSIEIETHVLHAKDVVPLTPDEVIDILQDGNDAFVEHHTQNRDAIMQLKESSRDGQHPLAIVLSCIDARVPVEMIFDKGVGDLFVTRIAGNVVSGDVLGSMEYACEHAGSKLVVVMGHNQCGAVNSACEGVQAGNMTGMLAKIEPAIKTARQSDPNGDGIVFLNEVSRQNALNMVEEVRKGSDILREMEEKGEIKIVAAIFDIKTGEVEFL